MIIVIDFGSQSTHLISRRLREISISSKIILPEHAVEEIKKNTPQGIILSGGPSSVYENGAPQVDVTIFEFGIPVLGICYGEQLIAHLLGGEVQPGKVKEYGPATLTLTHPCELFNVTSHDHKDKNNILGLGFTPHDFHVWMSHGDSVVKIPTEYQTVGHTETIPHAAIVNPDKKIYGIQFHPEVVHTQFGLDILRNFATLCGLSPENSAITKKFVEGMIEDVRESLGEAHVIGALSGGVDSSIATLMLHSAIGNRFHAVYIDSGLMREGETEELEHVFKSSYDMHITIVHAEKEFLTALQDKTDPEEKRKAIGKTFIEILDREAKKIGATFLMQGTIYPDVIESAGTKHSKNIKSHHNVGGLPPDMQLTLVEPLRNLYKDEVRTIGTLLNLPRSITHRHPFPGPGLAIRIIGEVTKTKLDMLRKADRIVQDEIEKSDLKDSLWQAFAVFTGIKTTGVRGDDRAYGETVAIRAVQAEDVMSGNFARIPYEVLEKISVRIVTEIPAINRVLYDVTNKPPATIEWE